jgi:hypothetical protein
MSTHCNIYPGSNKKRLPISFSNREKPAAQCALPGGGLFYPALKNAAREENAAAAFETLKTDIRAEPDHLPVITAAGMDFFETDDITEPGFLNHHTPLCRRIIQAAVYPVSQVTGDFPGSDGKILAFRGI